MLNLSKVKDAGNCRGRFSRCNSLNKARVVSDDKGNPDYLCWPCSDHVFKHQKKELARKAEAQ